MALITANIIYIREMKTRVMTELVQLHLRLDQPDFETQRGLGVKTTLLYQAPLNINDTIGSRVRLIFSFGVQGKLIVNGSAQTKSPVDLDHGSGNEWVCD